MTQDQDDIDFDAWGVPPSPDVTDAVIAKARVPMATATETVDAKRSTRTMLLAGGAIALSVAAIVIAVMVDRSKQPPPAPSISDLRVEELEQKVNELETAIEKLNAIGTEPTPEPAPAMMPPTPEPTPSTPCDADELKTEGIGYYAKSRWGEALVVFEQAFDCKPSAEIALYATLSSCKSGREPEARRFYAHVDEQKRANVQQSCLQTGIKLGDAQLEDLTASGSPSGPCDADALLKEGKGYYGKSQWGAALSAFEKALDCKETTEAWLFASLAACKSGRSREATRYFAHVAEDKRPVVQQTCLQKGIELGVTPADEPIASDSAPKTCDAEALQKAGKDFYAKGQWSAALQKMTESYDCKADPQTALFAALAACKSNRAADAKRWYQKSPEARRSHIQQACLQNGIALE